MAMLANYLAQFRSGQFASIRMTDVLPIDNLLMLHQQPVPSKLREAAYDLDGLLEHGTELEPTVCFTDTHDYTETMLAAAYLLVFPLAPRIKDVKEKSCVACTTKLWKHVNPFGRYDISPDRLTNSGGSFDNA